MALTTNNHTLLEHGDQRVELLRGTGPERQACEQELIGNGYPLPLPHRCAWARLQRADDSWFLAVRDGECYRGGFALDVRRSRALPGHLILRAERFGQGLPEASREACVAALEKLARGNRRILRVHVELFSREQATREAVAASLRARGFRELREGRRYASTVAIDLRTDEAGILASFHPTARRHIRALGKHPVVVRAIDEVVYAGRMEALHRETLGRTGGKVRQRDWAAVIALSRECPEVSRLVGLFRTALTGPDSLLAFAWGCGHGDCAHYDAAASTRQSDLRIPLVYALVWDLVCWAKRNGAQWFDFGGVTEGTFGSEDRLGGISDFKRYFSKDIVSVGGEWLLEPHWVRARLAGAISKCVSWVSK
ncbi:MAG TPA: GNAT family N-acetyltransferase [Gemmataceae bacterium]|nr:GNAT family N-acetyltransferase [Gemmataceae bacterium]